MATALKRMIRADAGTRNAGADRKDPGVSDEQFLVELGRRVREARTERGLARKTFADQADVSERYLAQLESGEGNASVTLLRRVAAALGLRLTELVEGKRSAERQSLARLLDSLPETRLATVLQSLTTEFGADAAVRQKRLALIGLRGAGKSTLGQLLAKELRRPFVELDREIEREAGMDLSGIFLMYGQPGYRRIERRCLDRIISTQNDVVLSIGGGVVSEPETYDVLLSNCYTFWVKASPAEHMSRVVAQGDMRPMKGHTQAMEDLKTILAQRDPLYARADAVVDTSGRSVEKSLAALRRIVASLTV